MWALCIFLGIAAIVDPWTVVGEQRTQGTSVVRAKDKNPASGQESLAEVLDAAYSLANMTHRITPFVSEGHWHQGDMQGSDYVPPVHCQLPAPRRNRHKMCFSSECGPPPTAFMVAIAHGETQLESFASASEVLWDTWWSWHVTKTQINGHMTVVNYNCSCNEGCDEWNRWALEQLATPAHCKYPGHEWRQLFKDTTPPTDDYVWVVPTTEGQTWANPNLLMEGLGLDATIAYQGFHNGATYKHVAQRQPSTVWEAGHEVNHTLNVRAGHKIVLWQYILTCKVFNSHNMYINEAHFGTNIKVTTSSTQRPTCNPNIDHCGMSTAGHHC